MSQDKQKSIAAMRTFARDLSRERGEGATTVDTKDTVPEHPSNKSHHKEDHHAAAPTPIIPPKKTDDVSIPAFHELQKASAVTPLPTPKLGAVTSKKPVGITPEHSVGGGTIITDNKIAKKSFLVALSESLTTWAKNLQKQFKRKKKPTYSVTSTERRKGVVQKATSKSGAIFSADKQELQQIIKRRQRDAEQKHDDNTDETIEWTPFTEPGFLLLDGAHEEIIASAPPVVEKPAVTITPKQSAARVDFVPPPPTVAPVAAPPVPPPTILPPEPPTPAVPMTDAPPANSTEIFEEEITAPSPQPQKRTSQELTSEPTTPWWSLAHLYNLSTNEMTVLAVAALFVVTIGGYIGVTMATTDGEPNIESSVPVLGLTSTPLIAITATTSNGILTAISATQNTTVPAELYFSDDSEERSGAAVLQTLISNRGDMFIQTADVARIITAADSSRVLIVRVTDTINARGGLLDWESTMYRDVAPILSNRDILSGSVVFTDSMVSGVDVRVLSIDTQPLVVYGFVDDRTVLIAPSSLAFSSAMSILTK